MAEVKRQNKLRRQRMRAVARFSTPSRARPGFDSRAFLSFLARTIQRVEAAPREAD